MYKCCCLACDNDVNDTMLCDKCKGWCSNCKKCYNHCERQDCLTADLAEQLNKNFEELHG